MSALSSWNCAVCTMENIGARTRCEACGTPRPTRAATPTPSPLPPALSQSVSSPSLVTQRGAWNCPTCTLENSGNDSRCAVCDTPRPADAAAATAPPPVPKRPTASSPVPVPSPAPKPPSRPSPTNATNTTATAPRKSSTPKSRIDDRYYEQHRDSVDFLTAMGFDIEMAIMAVKASDGNKELALDHLTTALPKGYTAKTPAKPITSPRRATPGQLSLPTGGRVPSTSSSAVPPLSSSPPPASALSRSVPNTVPTFQPAVAGPSPANLERMRREAEQNAKEEAAAAAKREAERNRLMAELRLQEAEVKRKEKEARLSEIAATNARRAAEERDRKLAIIKRDRELEESHQRELRDREERIVSKADREVSLAEALTEFNSQYDTHRVHETLHMLIKIISNALSKGATDSKFLSLSLHSERVVRAIVRPVFGLLALKKVGWAESEGRDTISATLTPQTRQSMQSALALFTNEVAAITTSLPQFFDTVLKNHSVELVYYLALELRAILGNVIAAPEERNFRSIDLDSDTYHLLFDPVAEIGPLLDSFGFTVHASNVYRIVESPNIRLFEAAVIDTNKFLASVQSQTPIVSALKQLLASNRPRVVKAFNDQLVTVLSNVVNDPHEPKYHRVRVMRLVAKVGEMTGAAEVFPLFGFELSEDVAVAALPYPGFNAELLRIRLEEWSRAWKAEMQARREAKEAQQRESE